MQPKIRSFYEYFEERSYRGISSGRQRNADAFLSDLTVNFWETYYPSAAGWHHARALEGRQDVSDQEGVWPINFWRADRYYGDPGRVYAELVQRGEAPAHTLAVVANSARLHHYYRAHDEAEIRSAVRKKIEVRLALKVTEAWSNPHGGWIEPSNGRPITGAHAIPVISFDEDLEVYPFRNSWGEEWGDRGWGYIDPSIIREDLIGTDPTFLNPTLGCRELGIGSDADLISGGCLTEIKVTKKGSMSAEWLDQILGYLILLRFHGRTNPTFSKVNRLALYFPRHGCFWARDTQVWTDRPGFADFERWFLDETPGMQTGTTTSPSSSTARRSTLGQK